MPPFDVDLVAIDGRRAAGTIPHAIAIAAEHRLQLLPRKLTVAARMAGRTGHFMPPALLQSQFADLEPPGPDEGALTLYVRRAPEAIAAEAARLLENNRPAKAPETNRREATAVQTGRARNMTKTTP